MRVASAAPLTTEDTSKAQSRKHLTDKTAPAIEAMSKAFEGACIALQVYAGDEKDRSGALHAGIFAWHALVLRLPRSPGTVLA